MDDEVFLKHLNARHMPMPDNGQGGVVLAHVPNMTPTLRRAWEAYHRRIHRTETQEHDHRDWITADAAVSE